MNDEKIYTQEDLNNAVTKAICEMTEVLNQNNTVIELYKKALAMACEDYNKWGGCAPSTATLVNSYLQKARENNAD